MAAMTGMASASRAAVLVGAKPFGRGAPLRACSRVQRQSSSLVVKAGSEQVGSAYANALVGLAQQENALDGIHADMDAFQTILKEDADILEFMVNPGTDETKKKEMLAQVAKQGGFNQYTINFLSLLMDAGRMDSINAVCDAFETRYCELTDTQVATLRSAVKLEQEQQFLIAKKLQELTGSKNIKLKPVIDESLIAGFIVEYGSSQIDLSVKGQLDKISGELEAAAVA